MSDTITITPEERRLLRSGGYGDYERLRLLNALEQAESRAEKAESDKTALEEDLEATEKNLKESSGFIEELLSGLKHRFPVQYADLEGDEYGDDAFSSHDLFELVIDPAVNAAQKAEVNVAQLISAAPDLFEALKAILPMAENGAATPGHEGFCGPEQSCDCECMHAAYDSERLYQARTAIAKAEVEG